MQLEYYKIKNGYLDTPLSGFEEGCVVVASGVVDLEKLSDKAYKVVDGIVELSPKHLALKSLNNTDWKVTRHRDQLALGIDTSLSDEEYQTLLTNRQTWRNTK